MKRNSTKSTESDILSVKDLLHLQAMPTIDNSKFVIQPTKAKPSHVVNVSNITEEQRRRYFSTGMDNEDSVLARKMQQTVKKMEVDAACRKEHAETREREAIQQNEEVSSELDFGSLITDHVLKDI